MGQWGWVGCGLVVLIGAGVRAGAEPAPAFEVETVQGGTVSLEESLEAGRPVVVYFMASWCPSCARNWPALNEVYAEFEGEVDLVGISVDPTDDAETIGALVESGKIRFPATTGQPRVMLAFGVRGQATTVGVDREGEVVFRENGKVLSVEEYRERFAGLAEEEESDA